MRRLDAFRALQAGGLGVIDVGSRGGSPVREEIGPLIDLYSRI